MLTVGLSILVLLGLLLFERWYFRHRPKKPNGFTDEERERYFDELRRKRSAEMKERKREQDP